MIHEVLFGGTFDPFHRGHLAVLEALQTHLQPTHIRVLPSAVPPHRALPTTPARDRLAMVQLAVGGRPGVIVDDRELRRAGPSFTADTLIELEAEEPRTSRVMALGADALFALDRWERVDEILSRVRIAMVDRFGKSAHPPVALGPWRECTANAAVFAEPPATLCRVPMQPVHLSATMIRAAITGDGALPTHWVSEAVAAYITKHQLYTDASCFTPRCSPQSP